MTKIFLNCEFTEVTAICAEFPEDGRRNAILVHDLSDRFSDGDGVCFEIDTMPEDEEEAQNILESAIDTESETLKSIKFVK